MVQTQKWFKPPRCVFGFICFPLCGHPLKIRWFNVTFVCEPFFCTLHFIGNHRRPLVMRDLSGRLVSGRKEPGGGGGGGEGV